MSEWRRLIPSLSEQLRAPDTAGSSSFTHTVCSHLSCFHSPPCPERGFAAPTPVEVKTIKSPKATGLRFCSEYPEPEVAKPRFYFFSHNCERDPAAQN